jgi:hypothetical protein
MYDAIIVGGRCAGSPTARRSAAMFIRYDRPIAALIWVALSAVHRHLMPGLPIKTVRLHVQRSHDPAASPKGGHLDIP